MPNPMYDQSHSLSPGRSMFNLSYSKMLTCDMGQLIPVMADFVVPGDIFQIGSESVIRMQPLVAPVMHEINVYCHYFFVPYRLLWPKNDAETDGWEVFISGGVSGDLTPAQPVWHPSSDAKMAVGSLWDYLGFPTGLTAASMQGPFPTDFIRRAYNFIWNDFYRDETLQTKIDLTNEDILLRAWEKDYFTSSLLNQQRGTSPALPIAGSAQAVWDAADFAVNTAGTMMIGVTAGDRKFYGSNAQTATNMRLALNDNVVDLSVASTFDIADLRLAMQLQKWMERNSRGGVRYTELLRMHFNVAPRDERLQRPEYIGGTRSPIIVSEVLQTSSTDATTPQANMAGHGITAQAQFAGKYHVQEYGIIMGLMSIMPRTMYQQGINRQWLQQTKEDYYWPEFAHLSEQAVLRQELYYTATKTDNETIFGYQGRYNEYRSKDNLVVGEMRSTFDYWHIGREFASAPILNEEFIKCNPRKDIFAVTNKPGFLVNWGNKIHALRPMPVEPVPGLIDHF